MTNQKYLICPPLQMSKLKSMQILEARMANDKFNRLFFSNILVCSLPSPLFSLLMQDVILSVITKISCNKLHPDIRVTYINQEIINGSSYSIMLGIDSLFILIKKKNIRAWHV